jgi:hypothetical protein
VVAEGIPTLIGACVSATGAVLAALIARGTSKRVSNVVVPKVEQIAPKVDAVHEAVNHINGAAAEHARGDAREAKHSDSVGP